MSTFTKREQIAKEIFLQFTSGKFDWGMLSADFKKKIPSEISVRYADNLLKSLEDVPPADLESRIKNMSDGIEKLIGIDFSEKIPELAELTRKSHLRSIKEGLDKLLIPKQ